MNANELLNEILAILRTFKEDKTKLNRIHQFLLDEIYEEPPAPEMPEKYKSLIAEIADCIGSDMICFVNTDTFEMEWLPDFLNVDPEEYELMTGESVESLDLKHLEWKNSIKISPLESFESFKIMEGFVDRVPDLHLGQQLRYALNNRKPFAHFKNLIDDSAYRQDWFDFRQKWLGEYVFGLLEEAIEKKETTK